MITAFLQYLGEQLRQELTAAARLHPELAELPVLVAFHDPAPEGDCIAISAQNVESLVEGAPIYRVDGELAIVVHANSRNAAEAKDFLAAAAETVLRTLCFGWHERSLPTVGCHVYALTPAPEPLGANGSAYESRLSFTATLQFFAPPCAG